MFILSVFVLPLLIVAIPKNLGHYRDGKVNKSLMPIILHQGLPSIFQSTLVHLRSGSMLLRFLCPYYVSPPTLLLKLPCAHATFLTAPLSAGGAQQLAHLQHASSLQCSRAFSRRSEPSSTSRNFSHRKPQKKSRGSISLQPRLTCKRPSHEAEPTRCC